MTRKGRTALAASTDFALRTEPFRFCMTLNDEVSSSVVVWGCTAVLAAADCSCYIGAGPTAGEVTPQEWFLPDWLLQLQRLLRSQSKWEYPRCD